MTKVITFALIALAAFSGLWGCVDHDISDPGAVNASDSSLYNEVKDIDGFTYYQNGSILQPASPSPHGVFKLRLNAVASEALDDAGELPSGSQFPVGSIIVKEVYQNSSLALLAVMKKAPTDANAGQGWLWAEYLLDGQPLVSIQGRGTASCINCHSGTPNRDLVRTFDLH